MEYEIVALIMMMLVMLIEALFLCINSKQRAKIIEYRKMAMLRNYMNHMEALAIQYKHQCEIAQRHKYFLDSVLDMVEKCEYKEALAYIEQTMEAETQLGKTAENVNEPINAVLNSRVSLAETKGIMMSLQMDELSALSFDEESCIFVLSYLLDDAIAACELLSKEQRVIEVELLSKKTSDRKIALIVHIQYACEPLDFKKNKMALEKPQGNQCCLGLPLAVEILHSQQIPHSIEYNNGRVVFFAEWPNQAKQNEVLPYREMEKCTYK